MASSMLLQGGHERLSPDVPAVNQKRSISEAPRATVQQGPFLEFPPFHQNVLMQRSWDAREHSGRIKGELELTVANDIVCFSFQHAPKEILEQAGISWPIRNPLYLASAIREPQIPQVTIPHTKARDLATQNRVRSSLSQHSPSTFTRPQNPDTYARSKTDPPPHLSQFRKLTTGGKAFQTGFWDPSFADSFSESYEDMNMDSRSTKRTNSHSTLNTSMPDMLYASPVFGKPEDTWTMMDTPYELEGEKSGGSKQPRRDKGTRQVVVALRDDQLGQLIEAISPPKKGRERDFTGQRYSTAAFPTQTSAQLQSRKLSGPVTSRPSAAAVARKASYQELQQTNSRKTSPDKMYQLSCSNDKENWLSSQAQDTRLPSPFPLANRVSTPHPFVVPQAQMNRWDSDVSMRDSSSILSRSERRRPLSKEGKGSPAPIPAASGGIKSRKEGINTPNASPAHDIRHDQTLLPKIDLTSHEHNKPPHNTPLVTSPPDHIEDVIIDIDAVDEAAITGHKSGVSSIDSTGLLEQKLYSALGEELSFHASAEPMTGIDSEAVTGAPDFQDFDTPIMKRKRQGTLGGERDHSPITKMVREEPDDAKLIQSPDMPRLRGGE
ncbi:hypothetical protein N0V90_009256 [Kalmusia sp. IMI 367209]|nr:hypothetical protein N0V90_009256 [Kalmusia sp. IMI 367209]